MNQVCIMLLFLKSFMPKSINFTIQELLIIQNTIQVFKFNEDCPRSIKLDSYKFHAITLVLLFYFFIDLDDNHDCMFFYYSLQIIFFYMALKFAFFINLAAAINTTNKTTGLCLSVICDFNQRLLLLKPKFESENLLSNLFSELCCWIESFLLSWQF